MRLNLFKTLLFFLTIIISLFYSIATWSANISMTRDLLIIKEIFEENLFPTSIYSHFNLSLLIDPILETSGIQQLNAIFFLFFLLLSFLIITLNQSKANYTKVAYIKKRATTRQQASDILKQNPHIVWTELLNSAE